MMTSGMTSRKILNLSDGLSIRFNNFRKKINKEYAEFLKNPWEEFTEKKPLVIPKEDDVPPVIYPEEERNKPFPAPEPLPYDVVIPVPKPAPQPKPVEPIKENPEPMPKVDFLWFGTKLSVRFDTSSALQMTRRKRRCGFCCVVGTVRAAVHQSCL